MADIREILQKAEGPSATLDRLIWAELTPSDPPGIAWSRDYTTSIALIEARGYDWIMANVNGTLGGTPFGCVGVPEDKASFSGTALLSLWLSFFRLELGDERETSDESR
jgi:hypothetical protein